MKRENLHNNVRLMGELVSKNVHRRNENTADETLSLEVVVRTGESEEHVVSYFAYKYGKGADGKRVINKDKISKLFTGYETVVNEFKTMEDSEDGKGEIVDIKGELSKNRYVDKNSGQLKEFDKIKGVFCSRVKDMSKYTPCAVWDAHMHITKIKEDVKDNTGEYVVVTGMIVGYTEEEYDFRIYSEKTRKGFLKKFDEHDSAKFEGRIVNRPDEAVSVEEVDEDDNWGEEMEVSASGNTIRRRYLEIVTGDKKPMDTDDEDHPLNEDKIKGYRQNIKTRRADTMSKFEKDNKEKNNAPKIDPNKIDDDEVIPF